MTAIREGYTRYTQIRLPSSFLLPHASYLPSFFPRRSLPNSPILNRISRPSFLRHRQSLPATTSRCHRGITIALQTHPFTTPVVLRGEANVTVQQPCQPPTCCMTLCSTDRPLFALLHPSFAGLEVASASCVQDP